MYSVSSLVYANIVNSVAISNNVTRHTEPVEAPPVPPLGGASRMLRGLMLRDLALLLVNRRKKNVYIFS